MISAIGVLAAAEFTAQRERWAMRTTGSAHCCCLARALGLNGSTAAGICGVRSRRCAKGSVMLRTLVAYPGNQNKHGDPLGTPWWRAATLRYTRRRPTNTRPRTDWRTAIWNTPPRTRSGKSDGRATETRGRDACPSLSFLPLARLQQCPFAGIRRAPTSPSAHFAALSSMPTTIGPGRCPGPNASSLGPGFSCRGMPST